MIADLFKQWLLAELKASASVVSAAGGAANIGAAGYDLASSPGVYVSLEDTDRVDSFSERTVARLRCVGSGVAGLQVLMDAVVSRLDSDSGRPKVWLAPRSGFRLKSLRRVSGMDPDRDGPNDVWVAVLAYEAYLSPA